MPRKKSDIPSATRIRENQRRFRSRRKELVEDLQKRLREYERRELQKTLAIQLAAKHVAWENSRLRDLLASVGVSSTEVATFLRQQEHVSTGDTTSDTAKKTPQSSTTARDKSRLVEPLDFASSTCQNPHEISGLVDDPKLQKEKNCAGLIQDHDFSKTTAIELEHLSPSGSADQALREAISLWTSSPSNDSHECSSSDHLHAVDVSPNTILPTVSDYFCPAPPISGSSTGGDLKLEMSCETAASIITSMRGVNDVEQIRSQLGCESRKDCSVQGLTVMRVMEMN